MSFLMFRTFRSSEASDLDGERHAEKVDHVHVTPISQTIEFRSLDTQRDFPEDHGFAREDDGREVALAKKSW